MTTAAGITSVVDLTLQARSKYHGFVPQERFRLPEILANRFGKFYAPGGTKDISSAAVVSGQAGNQRVLTARRKPTWTHPTVGETIDMKDLSTKDLLGRLGLQAINPGAWSGSHGWSHWVCPAK